MTIFSGILKRFESSAINLADRFDRSRIRQTSGQRQSKVSTGITAKIKMSNSAIALLLAVFTTIFLAASAHDIGLTWDEPIYFEASESYVSWLGELIKQPEYALSAKGIKEYWGINHEHPPFDKIWSGIVWAGARYAFDDLTAHRLGNIILSGSLFGLLYLMIAPGHGRTAGLASAGALFTMPRFFFHAHLAALDVPATATIFLVGFLFWRTLDRPDLKWSVWLGIAFGVALGTKINALIEIPILLGLWALFFKRKLYVFIRLAIMGLIGIIVFLLFWPWLYHDSFNRLRDYIDFMTVNHYEIEQYYLGRWLAPPPWHYPFVMILMVVPLALSILAAVGFIKILKEGNQQPLGWLLVLGALVPLSILATGKTQIFDGERLLMPSFPYIAALSGIGFAHLILGIHKLPLQLDWERWKKPLILLSLLIIFLPHIILAYSLYPHLLSYYSEGIGGLPGAKRLRMETTYWAETYNDTLYYLNAYAPERALVWVEAHDVMLYYQAHGVLRPDLRIASPFGDKAIVKGMQGYRAEIKEADIAVIEYRESGFSNDMIDLIQNQLPVYQLCYRQIPLVGIFTR